MVNTRRKALQRLLYGFQPHPRSLWLALVDRRYIRGPYGQARLTPLGLQIAIARKL